MKSTSAPDTEATPNAGVAPPEEQQIDNAVEDSFPASDPPSHSVPGTSAPTEAWLQSSMAEIELWRVVEAKDIEGAFRRPCANAGRWSTQGTPVIYAAGASSTALLEYLAHMESEPSSALFLIRGRVPGQLTLVAGGLPSTWHDIDYRPEVQAIGDAWAAHRSSLIMEVPSVLCPGAFNYLINPMHEDARQIEVSDPISLKIDRRLVRQAKGP